MNLALESGAEISYWMSQPEAHNGAVTHFTYPLAGASLILGLRAGRAAPRPAVAYLAQAAMHFPPDDLQKVVATWYLADTLASCGGAVEVGSVRAVAAAAANVEAKFKEGAFGGPIADEDIQPRGRVRALLRETSALAEDAALPGPAVACSYFDLQKTGGAKFVSLLISGIPDTPAVRAVSPEMFAGLQISET